jgi:hypothetical protein
LPSRPVRAFDCGISSLERFLIAATVLAARPVVWPIARSDICGCVVMIRSTAARRHGGTAARRHGGTAARRQAVSQGQRQAVRDVLQDRA